MSAKTNSQKSAKVHVTLELKGRIAGLHQAGTSYRCIQKLLKSEGIIIPLTTINRIAKTFRTTGTLARKPGSGRPKVTTSRDDRRLKRTVSQHPKTTFTNLAKDFKTEKGDSISRKTIARRLKQAGFSSKRCLKKPLLSKKNVKDRRKFFSPYGGHNAQWFERVLWSDESRFALCNDAPERCIRRPTEKYKPECLSTTVKHGGGGIMVWGVFSASGVGDLVRCDKSVTAKEYQNILRKGLLPSLAKLCTGDARQNAIFQQDNAPAHTAKSTQSWFERQDVPVMFWPGQSPDLNPIENIWSHIKVKLAGKKFSTADLLWEAVKRE